MDREHLLWRADQCLKFAAECKDRNVAEQLISLAQYCQTKADETEPEPITGPMYHGRFGALKALATCIDGRNSAHSRRA
jgi:hypothetical protein